MMKQRRLLLVSRLALGAATLCAVATAAHAQTITAYSTGFDGTDVTNGTATAATYNSPNTPTDPLDGQNGWTTNDGTQTGTYGTSTQLVGRSDFVGITSPAFFTGQVGVLGGIYRTTTANATGAAPDVVPSTATGGNITLSHGVTVGPGASFLALNVDFAVTAPNGANAGASFNVNRDAFSFSLQNAAGASLITFSFVPSSTPTTFDDTNLTIGTTTATPGNQISLNGMYHLAFNVNTATNQYSATISSAASGATANFGGDLSGASITAGAVTQFVASWKLGDTTTISNGGYQNASDDNLVFDNLAVTVPEPSTYALLAVGVASLAGLLLRRRQA